MIEIYLKATLETLEMIGISGFFAVLCGMPLGILLFALKSPHLLPHRAFFSILNLLINFFRSIPFIILMIALIPFTRVFVGTSIGTLAALVPLTFAAIPFFARLTEESLSSLPKGLIDAGLALGATPPQILFKILTPECIPSLISHITTLLVNLVGYSAMAGTLGGGGLGSLAIHYGYQRFDTQVMISTVIILVLLVQLIQTIGDALRKFFERRFSL